MKSIRPSYLPYFQLWQRPSYSSWIRSPTHIFIVCFAFIFEEPPNSNHCPLFLPPPPPRPIPCALHHPVFSSRPVTWNCAWIIFSVDKAAVLFFKSPLDRTSTKEWISHQADFCSPEGENTLWWEEMGCLVRPWVPHDCTHSREDQTPFGRNTREVRCLSSYPLTSLQVIYESKASRSLESLSFGHADCSRKKKKTD